VTVIRDTNPQEMEPDIDFQLFLDRCILKQTRIDILLLHLDVEKHFQEKFPQ